MEETATVISATVNWATGRNGNGKMGNGYITATKETATDNNGNSSIAGSRWFAPLHFALWTIRLLITGLLLSIELCGQ
jgi:hypothetical protein